MKKKIILNLKFNSQGQVECCKSPNQCKYCSNEIKCEEMELFYYPFKYKDIKECFTNDERRR